MLMEFHIPNYANLTGNSSRRLSSLRLYAEAGATITTMVVRAVAARVRTNSNLGITLMALLS